MYSMKRNETAEHWCRRIAGIVCLTGAFAAPALALPEKEGVTLSPDGQLSVTLHEPQGGAESFVLSLKCGEKEVFRCRSAASRCTSSSVETYPVPKGPHSASREPFSAIRLWPPNTRSVEDSPSPASAYT